MTKKETEIAQECFHFLAEALAQADMFEGLELPLIVRPQHNRGRPNPFPCIHDNEEELRRLNAERDQRDDTQRDPVIIRPIDSGRYYVALPRTGNHIPKRAVQLLEACVRPQEERQ